MAKIIGGIKIKGTVDNVCFYKMDGQYYVRMKPGPERKAFLKNGRYAPQREASVRMNKGNKIASLIYNQMARDKRVYRVNCGLQKRAAGLLKGGLSVAEVSRELCNWMVEEGYLDKRDIECLIKLTSALDFRDCVPGSGMKKDIDHFKGVQIQTVGGRWIRLYHMDEWELLCAFEAEIERGDAWVEVFLERRKRLSSYRLKHRYKRRVKRGMSDARCEDVRCKEQDEIRVNVVPSVARYPVLKVSDRKGKQRRKSSVLNKIEGGLLVQGRQEEDVGYGLMVDRS